MLTRVLAVVCDSKQQNVVTDYKLQTPILDEVFKL